jgi:hypothetical protein
MGADPVAHVVSLNLKRRHLTESQRAMVADKLARLPAHRPDKTAQICAVLSQEEAAALLNVSRRTVQEARKIHEKAAQGVIDAVEAGTLTIHAALPGLPVQLQDIL